VTAISQHASAEERTIYPMINAKVAHDDGQKVRKIDAWPRHTQPGHQWPLPHSHSIFVTVYMLNFAMFAAAVRHDGDG
jgi:hypothetical protein